jgi:hypothetical protein
MTFEARAWNPAHQDTKKRPRDRQITIKPFYEGIRVERKEYKKSEVEVRGKLA